MTDWVAARLEESGWAAAAMVAAVMVAAVKAEAVGLAAADSESEAAVAMAAEATEGEAWEGWAAMAAHRRKPQQTKVSEFRLSSRDTTGDRKPRWMSTRW